MTDLIKQLRLPGYDLGKEQAIQGAIAEIRRLTAEVERLNAKITVMEQQEPVAEVGHVYMLNWCGFDSITNIVKRHNLKIGDKLFAAPGAKGD